jgi:hypothetical protein
MQIYILSIIQLVCYGVFYQGIIELQQLISSMRGVIGPFGRFEMFEIGRRALG